MAEEPQPSNIASGADAPDVLPASKEDRKAAAALSSLDAKPNDDAAPKKEVDLKALGEAMKTLDMAQGAKKTAAGAAAQMKKEDLPTKKALVKVDVGDVNLLVEQLDLTKAKATDLLRAHDADAQKAMMAWVSAAV